MKKLVSLLLLAALLCLTACGGQQPAAETTVIADENQKEMTVQPATLSQDSQQVLSLLDGDTYVWDCRFEEGITQTDLHFYVCKGGVWEQYSGTVGPLDGDSLRILLYAPKADGDLVLSLRDENGTSRLTVPRMEYTLPEDSLKAWMPLSASQTVTAGEETTLWVEMLTTGESLGASTADFRSASCEEGMALVLSVE